MKKKEMQGDNEIISFIERELSFRTLAPNTLLFYRNFLQKLEKFGVERFAELDTIKIAEFDRFLRQTMHSSATRYKHHATLHGFIRLAQNDDLCRHDPYLRFRVRREEGEDPVFLVEEEIQRIQMWRPYNKKLEAIQDCFIFQIFTGMAYSDVCNFSREKVQEVNVRKVVSGRRQKTRKKFLFPLLPSAERVAKKYDYRLPVVSIHLYNQGLKILAAACGINKRVTSHTGRHTFATYLLNKGVRIEVVARAMGHANINMTQHYARMLGTNVIEEIAEKCG